MINLSFEVLNATEQHIKFAEAICKEMEVSAMERGTGISKRTPEQVIAKIREGKAIIALTDTQDWAGFCYIQAWQNEEYVSNSGLIVAPQFRKNGLARQIKHEIFNLCRQKYPESKIFGLTTSAAVMRINSALGYEPVIYSEITTDEHFWTGCKSCVNYDILLSKNKKNCLCTAMLFEPLAETISTDYLQSLSTFQ